MTRVRFLVPAAVLVLCSVAAGQSSILFDFNNAPPSTPLPTDVTVGGVTAHLSATGQGYSIQNVGSVPVVPTGFAGNFIYPSSVFLSDLLVSYSTTVTAFSIHYAADELGCDDSARVRVTAYMNATFVGTETTTVPNPGTYPVGTLAITAMQGFNNVVVHYDAHPPTCQDYGVIFFADDMQITVPQAAWSAAVGNGCGGFGDPAFACTTPRVGQNVTLTLSQATPDASGFVFYGNVPLAPTALGSGCDVQLWLSAFDVLMPVATDATGHWSTTVPIPLEQVLVGRHAAMQIALFPTGGPLGFDLSNGIVLTMGY